MVAALAGYADVVDYLVVQKNADFRRINPVYAQISLVHICHATFLQTGAQCIHLAAKSGSLETLQLIISYGADTNARTDPPLLQSPLHFAAANPTFEACQMLLEHGANIMAQDAVRVKILL
jgi:ankyrin repeat protein